MIAYHASPDSFDEFVCTEQGVHVGPKESALEAVSRKTNGTFYLYKVDVDVSCFVEEIDHGYDWRSVFMYEPESIKGYIYQNKYEPSSKPSYVTWKPEQTLKIMGVEKHGA
jgi:hypothetical protein